MKLSSTWCALALVALSGCSKNDDRASRSANEAPEETTEAGLARTAVAPAIKPSDLDQVLAESPSLLRDPVVNLVDETAVVIIVARSWERLETAIALAAWPEDEKRRLSSWIRPRAGIDILESAARTQVRLDPARPILLAFRKRSSPGGENPATHDYGGVRSAASS